MEFNLSIPWYINKMGKQIDNIQEYKRESVQK